MVGVPKIVLVEFFNVLFFDAVDDALDTDVGDRFLEFESCL